LGCCLVPELLQRGHSVCVFDRGCFGLAGLPDDCEVVQGDIRRLQEHPDLLDGIETVIHLAGLVNDPSCDLDREMAWDINVESSLELARQAMGAGIPRFLFASSCAVYGQGVFARLDEASPANPVSTFGRTKRAAEEGLLAMASATFQPIVVRAGTLFGVSPRMRFDLAINQMVATARRDGRIEVRGGGQQWRPFVHVRDAARAYADLLEAPASKRTESIYNLGSNALNLQIGTLADAIAAQIGGITVDRATDDNDLRDFRVNFDRIKDSLGFVCQQDLESGIAELSAYVDTLESPPFSEAYFNAERMRRLRQTPVAEGGDPVAARFVALSRPSLGPEEEMAVLETLRSGWLTSGHQIAAFEQAFSQTVGAAHTVAVNSCTAAIHLCLADIGVQPGDEVISTPITWASTGNTLLHMGAKIVFVDVESDTLNLDPAQVEAAITERTKAIIPVHLAGHPCDLKALRAIAKRHQIPLIEDAAHALGAQYNGTPIGGDSDYACFSFYSIKNITTIEGGMVALKDPDKAAHIRALATNGMRQTAWDRYGRSALATPLEVCEPGFKYLIGNVSAAMGVEQLKKFTHFSATRHRLARMYNEVLGDIPEIALPRLRPDITHGWHLYMIRLNLEALRCSRDEFAYALRQENIGTGVHFYGLHLHEYYRNTLGYRAEDFPVATKASERILSLPLHPQLTDKNVHEVATAVRKVIDCGRR
ncbi:MAG: bifunctional SDR family oxidoreductase/aminotransferase class I/II-fold pyridoxal phosphate-dependent enzyme, partial [Candidatus Hydrogenedentes bacterium]|nr:bifunctional SDR family oxidoreductase/aminotransferase class I/II-fold pyridoxal phosphate-dependent enzyme [Candidatus Hydrogenedentota bacterium]